MTDELTPRLRARAKSWATQITKLAHKNLGNKRRLINVTSTVIEDKGKIGVLSVATPSIPAKPVARAYEYGSGIHARLKRKSPKQLNAEDGEERGKILIRPKFKKILAFRWDVAETFEMERGGPGRFIFGKDGKVLLPSVKHPGVKAVNNGKGYLAPAQTEARRNARKELAKDGKEALLATFRKSFRKIGG